ncbi:nucleotidyltransferase domain-containing protein [candidate division WOR-3 bacterium]|nr:nucleotidyltransferase domain-containing protein [candidate division WOR-3 bacterium]
MNKALINKLRNFCRMNGITYCALFGSRARNDNKKDSDLDLLIGLKEEISGFKFVRLMREIEEYLGEKIDVVTKDGLSHPRGEAGKIFREEIEKDLKVIYEERK